MKSLKLNFILLLLTFIGSTFFLLTFPNSAHATHEWECDTLFYESSDSTCANLSSSVTMCSPFDQSQSCSNVGGLDFKRNCFTSSLCGMTLSLLSDKGTLVGSGETFNLSWFVNHNPTACTASGEWSGIKSTISGSSQAITAPLIPGSYAYTLTCSNTLTSASDSFLLTVDSSLPTSTPAPTIAPTGSPAPTIAPTGSPAPTIAPTGVPTPPPAICLTMTCDTNLAACASPCGDFVCDKRIFGAGKCVDKATFCPKLIIDSSCIIKNGDADCRDGTPGCANYFCWPDKLSKVIGTGKCKLGLPTPAPIRYACEKVTMTASTVCQGDYISTRYCSDSYDQKSCTAQGSESFYINCTDCNTLDGCNPDTKKCHRLVPAPKLGLQCTEFDDKSRCEFVETAIGKIAVDPASFVSRIMSLLLGLSGGIAILLIILAGYTLMTSRDKPESLQDARQRILGAIAGLIFIALALAILEAIGVDVLQIPGFEP